MRKNLIIMLVGLLLSASTVTAQSDSTQSPNDKRLIKMLARVSTDSTKLVKLQGTVSQFEKNKGETASIAQQSADDNKQAADRLADNPQDKKLARRARSAARTARNDSEKARVAATKLDDLNKDISKLSKRLGKEQASLSKYQASRAPAVSSHLSQ